MLTESINFVKDDKVLPENLEVAKLFNDFFVELSKRDEHIFRPGTSEVDHIEDSVFGIIGRFKKRPIMVALFENHKVNAFSFKQASLDEISKK